MNKLKAIIEKINSFTVHRVIRSYEQILCKIKHKIKMVGGEGWIPDHNGGWSRTDFRCERCGLKFYRYEIIANNDVYPMTTTEPLEDFIIKNMIKERANNCV